MRILIFINVLSRVDISNYYLSKLKVVDLIFSYFYFFLFSIFRTRVRVRVMRLHCYTSVTSDDTVIITITSYKIHKRT